MTDDDVDTGDIAPLDDAFFRRAALRPAGEAVTLTLHLDPDLVAWFKGRGGDVERRINAALRVYMEAHRSSDV
ncbi:MAG: BrnA antitoxin family protein [Thermodesulfobacteriota bacterium]